MKTENFSPRQALNKTFLRVKPNRSQVEKFQSHLRQLLGSINETESEEFHKNLLADFLKHSYYSPQHFIENLGLKPRRSTTALLLNINTFTKYMLKCETWKKPTRFDFTPHPNKSRYCGALWAV
ncbi:hypothetical protein GQR42_18000 [Microcystis aeruginosa FD4]|jgi:hypothetical protein|uniref:DUF7149 domain-containing protein n=1 Tax=Microcystis aeruginosa FD4 TaxID=2686288 RepID=A0A857D6B9_MICAE|nr:hypothetical protein [Microcystis aeruginosa]QGZ91113.1 hypothetical protein GQR42_18000 [Microcystis aeruginosa FD4]